MKRKKTKTKNSCETLPLTDCHRLTFKNVGERRSLVDKVDLVLIELAHLLQRLLVVRVNEQKIPAT